MPNIKMWVIKSLGGCLRDAGFSLASALGNIARAQAETGDIAGAVRTAKRIDDSSLPAIVLAEVAVTIKRAE